MKKKTRTEIILIVMNVLAWITFIGLMVKAGAILTSFVITLTKPEAAKNLYSGLNWYNLRQYDVWYYAGCVTMMAAIAIIQSYTAFLVIKVLSKIKMTNPFTMEIAHKLEAISYLIILSWVAAMIYNGQMEWLAKKVEGLNQNLFSPDFILIAGMLLVFAQIFKKGVEIQSENELTV